jgi:RNA polymerase sigma-70 factor (ECF subfamily)
MPSTEPLPTLEDEAALVGALKRGDRDVFAAVFDAYTPALVQVAMTYVPSRAVAEEVVQETWMKVISALDGFEGRSTLKHWMFRILRNTAINRGERERRTVPLSCLAPEEQDDREPLDPDRFLPTDHPQYPGHWALGPTPWPLPEEGLLAGETRTVIAAAIEALPRSQREVIALRDVEGWSSEEVCEALGLTPGNQRVLLHRGRAKVRAALERYFGAVEQTLPEGEL